jgi:SAM-dependent methyltransferase
MSDRDHWQLDGSAPELYERYLVPAITSIWAADLIERTGPNPGDSVLDIACGTGAVTRLAAERVATGRVVGLDLNAGMLAVARSVPKTGAASIEWLEGSALSLPFANNSFDLVLCQLGLQSFPDRPLVPSRNEASAGGVRSGCAQCLRRHRAHAGCKRICKGSRSPLGPDASMIKRAEHIFPLRTRSAP